ncbi:MAG: hypothetical protein IPI97_05005 [Nitrosomonas sp.]|nr:hypothetical protein [Nitrosomonas sp.]MBK7364367.1 hypothetical protein [Nitrosomonas sp.]
MKNDELELDSRVSNVSSEEINEEPSPRPRGGGWHWVPGHSEGGAWIAGYWEQD